MSTTTKDPDVEQLTALLRALLAAYTRWHRDMKINGAKLTSGVQISVQAHRDDHPRLVGSRGTHIMAIQTLFAFIGRRAGRVVRVTLLEPATGEKLPLEPYVENPKWKPEPMRKLLGAVASAVFGEGEVTLTVNAVGEMTVFEIAPKQAISQLMRDAEIEKAFHLIFHAIGKAQGRIVHVQLATGQPAECDGAPV